MDLGGLLLAGGHAAAFANPRAGRSQLTAGFRALPPPDLRPVHPGVLVPKRS
jgi:hypothetical protein